MRCQQANLLNQMLFSLILFFFVLTSASVAHAEDYTFVTKWGSYGSGEGQFYEAFGTAVDPYGNVYVANTGSDNIQKFSRNGRFLTRWGSNGTGEGQFNHPYGIAVDPSGNIYVSDTYNDRIQKFSPSGGFLTQFGSSGSADGQFYEPFDVAVDSSGNVYVSDLLNNRIQKFSGTGTFIAKWGSYGTGNGQFRSPIGIAVDSLDNVYVADYSNHRIQKFSGNGTFLTQWGSLGNGDGQFNYPWGIAIDSLDNVYVADYYNNCIQKFSSTGEFLTRWGSYGIGDGQFYYPSDVAVDATGRVYVVDAGNSRIQKFAGYKLRGINFSPYKEGQSPDYGSLVDREQVMERLTIIAPYTTWIRTYGTENGLENIAPAAHNMGLKTAIGAWLGTDAATNERQINELINETKAGYVDLAIVGSETLQRNDLSEDQLIDYIRRVKQEAPGINVTTADTYGELLNHPRVMAECDVIMYNSYPYWEGISIDNAIEIQDSRYRNMINQGMNKPILISETGWPSAGNEIGSAVPSPENSIRYLYDFASWASKNNVQYFYFEAFDEIWKTAKEGPQGAHWGIWDKAGNLKPGMETVLSGGEPEPASSIVDFIANTTTGSAPLSVLFTDLSQNVISRSWDFNNDGTADSSEANPVYIFTDPGNYTVNLTVTDEKGTASKTLKIVVQEMQPVDGVLPVADFSANVTSGYAPLSVLFTDLSQNATSRSWDIDSNGQVDSTDVSFVYVYTDAGTYTVNLTAVNENGTASKTIAIEVQTENSGDSGGGSSGGGSGGGGGGGGSPELQSNVEAKELSQAFVTSGNEARFEFPRNATCVMFVSFDAKKTFGKTTTIAELLKEKSSLIPGLPAGEIYRSFNVWVGNGGVATSKNIENPEIGFKVEKSWLQNKSIDPASMALNRYNDNKWEQFPVNRAWEDAKYLYFTSSVSGYSSFVITGKAKSAPEKLEAPENREGNSSSVVSVGQTNDTNDTNDTVVKGETKESTPGFEMVFGIACLLGVFLYRRK